MWGPAPSGMAAHSPQVWGSRPGTMVATMNWHLGASLAFALVILGCDNSQGGGEDTDGSSTSGGSGETGSDTAPSTTSPSTTGPTGCIAGQETCSCLDGDCIGTLQCVENICVPGPEFDVPGDPIRVIAGLRVPINAEILADTFGWEQTGGQDANVVGADSQTLLVDVPAGLGGGDVLTFTLSATRNGVMDSVDVTIEVVNANFEEGLPTIDDIEQLGTPTSVTFRGGQLWAVSNEGFVSWFDLDFDDELQMEFATHVGRHDIPGGPIGSRMGQVPGRDDDVDVVLVANAMNQALEAVTVNGGSVETLSDETVDAMPLGPVRHLVRMDDEIYMTNGESGQLLVWDPDPPEVGGDGTTGDMGIPAGTRVLLEGLAMPSAITTGPEDGYLYVGISGQVLRVPILEDGSAGAPDVYLDFGDTADPNLMVDGLMFDRANNMYAGVPLDGRLLVARYEAGGETSVVRDLDSAGANFSGFSGLSFGDDDFGRATLYYGNASGRVGRVFVGLGR